MKDARPTSVKRLWRFSDEGIKHMKLHTLDVSWNIKITDEGRSSYVSKTPMAFFR